MRCLLLQQYDKSNLSFQRSGNDQFWCQNSYSILTSVTSKQKGLMLDELSQNKVLIPALDNRQTSTFGNDSAIMQQPNPP